MKIKRIILLVTATAVMAVAFSVSGIGSVSAAADTRGGSGGRGNGPSSPNSGSGYALTSLSTDEEAALKAAILEEYGALNLYQAVISQLGNIYPFNQIVRSEQQHVNALVSQANKYGVEVPVNPGLSSVPTFDTLAEACQAGVAAETADAALYDTLKIVTTHTDILRVYNSLQSASLNNHLPAFQTCD